MGKGERVQISTMMFGFAFLGLLISSIVFGSIGQRSEAIAIGIAAVIFALLYFFRNYITGDAGSPAGFNVFLLIFVGLIIASIVEYSMDHKSESIATLVAAGVLVFLYLFMRIINSRK